MLYRDLRGWLDGVESFGELRVVEGADWNQEIGAVAEVAARSESSPAVLFDKIKDYPAGRRVLTGIHNPTLRQQCLTNHLPLEYTRDQFIDAWKKRLNYPAFLPPRVVQSGPVMQNVFEGNEIDLISLPVPFWHEGDGGRYIGTLEVTISFGPDPLLWYFGQMDVPPGESEYDYAGGIRGEPYEVIVGEHTKLPIPAYSEVAVEGEVLLGTKIPEGPFGEFTGYYAGGLRSEPVLKVKRLMYRNDPIITGAPPYRPAPGAENSLIRAAYIWDYLDKTGVPDVRGVAYYQTRLLVVVAIKQRYPGHARQAALIASQCRAAALLTRYIVVVDEDID